MKPVSLLLPVLIAALRNFHMRYFIAKRIAVENGPEIIFDDALLVDHASGCLLKNNIMAANTKGRKILVKSHAWANAKDTTLVHELKSSTIVCCFNCLAPIQLKKLKMSLCIRQ